MLNRTKHIIIVIASCILTLIATDILLPSLPHIAHTFAVPSNDVKMLISIFMIGQFATVLFWGIIADQLGRSQTLMLGMLVFFVGSMLSLNASSINILLVSRFLQGAGAVVVPVAGWALIQDLFRKDDAARIMSWIGTLVAIIPLFAPAIGGKIDVLFGWQANLYCIALYSTILALALIFLPKLKKPQLSRVPTLLQRLTIYGRIMTNKTFVSYIALFGLLNCGEWCFLTVAPFYYERIHIAPDVMGLLLMVTSIGFVLGTLIASQLGARFGIDKTISFGIQFAIVSSLIFLGGEYFHWDKYQLFNSTVIGLYILSSALLWGGTTSRALQCFDEFRGSASAIRSLILICFSAFGTYSGQLLNHNNLHQVGFFLLIMALCALIIFNNKEMKVERLSQDVAF